MQHQERNPKKVTRLVRPSTVNAFDERDPAFSYAGGDVDLAVVTPRVEDYWLVVGTVTQTGFLVSGDVPMWGLKLSNVAGGIETSYAFTDPLGGAAITVTALFLAGPDQPITFSIFAPTLDTSVDIQWRVAGTRSALSR